MEKQSGPGNRESEKQGGGQSVRTGLSSTIHRILPGSIRPGGARNGLRADSAAEGAWSDREIQKEEEDRFSFPDYADVLAKRASKADTPLTIGIYGRWGSGKSSLMRLTRAALPARTKKGGRVQSIWINVWQLSSQDEVWQAFLQALFSEVHGKLRWWERVDWGKLGGQVTVSLGRFLLVAAPLIIAWWIGSAATELEPLAEDAIAAGGVAATVGLLLLTAVRIGPIVEAFRQSWKIDLKGAMKYAHFDEQISELRGLQERFEELVPLWVGPKGRLIVFIDDLDRCTPEKVPEVLEAIKLFTTTPGCVYLIGLDHDVVRQGIQARYKFKSESAATEYLEKIVQVPFHLPPLDLERIDGFVRDHYPDLQQELPLQYGAIAEVFSEGLEPNPRKVKRALNIYRTLFDLAETRVAAWEMDPVDPVLLAKMVVIESRFRQLHDSLIQYPDILLAIEKRLAAENMLDVPDDRRDASEAGSVLQADQCVGPLLFGSPEPDGGEAQERLLDETALPAFIRMLWAGNRYFKNEEQAQISSYIYLAGIPRGRGGADHIRPDPDVRDALLSGERAKIQKQVDDILEHDADDWERVRIKRAFVDRLETVLLKVGRYTANERASAQLALDLLDGFEREDFEPPTKLIPAGPFLMGSDPTRDRNAGKAEQPQHEVDLPAYRIGRYPVTNAEYRLFVRETAYEEPDHWEVGEPPEGKEGHPVTWVTWNDAVAYCSWLSDKTGREYCLPSEAEWEKAARGADGRIFPWGDAFDTKLTNTKEAGIGDTSPVGAYPGGASPYGLMDMSGNVLEWTRSQGGEKWRYPWADDGRDDMESPDSVDRVVRGGSAYSDSSMARCAFRRGNGPDRWILYIGFRVAVSTKTFSRP